MFNFFSGALLIIALIPDAASYNKYGRTCKDIGCRTDETCVMAEDPCTDYTDKCGRYPTCRRTSDISCTSMVCGENEYCKSENGAPRCVRKSTGFGYESAGVSYVNGQRVNSENNANPYANANAPPMPAVPSYPSSDSEHHRSSSGSNLGYPPYPSNTGTSGHGYPQSTNQAGRQDLGYPPYPTQNRMPTPGQSAYPSYPQNSGYPQAPVNPQYPGYQNYPYQNYPNQPLPAGLNQVSHRSTTRVPPPPPRSSSYGGRYSGHSGFRNTVGDGSIFNRLFGDRQPRPTSSVRSTTQTSGNNYYNTHTHMDNHGNRIWTFSENKMRTRTIPKRQTSYPTATETHGSSDTPKNSDDQSYPARSSDYSSSSGYPGSSYPNSGSSRVSDLSNQPQSGYPSSGSSGYPTSGSSGYPSSGSSGYPSSGSSGYPSSGSSGYPSSGSSGYPSSQSSGYPKSGSGYPSSGSSGYPTSGSSGYPSSGSSGYPSSGSSNYPSRDSSGYPIGSAYPSRTSDSSGYPDNSRNFNGEETVKRTSASAVNAGYPSNPRTSAYPERNPSYGANYPAQNTGYPYNNQRSPYPNQGYSNGYSQNYPQGGYYPPAGYYPEGRYQGQNYMTTTNRPGIRDQLTNFARNMAEKVLTQTILDRITGRHQ
ncbi:hypothetical protein ALC53_07976 [Atta colombica]|uniref:Translation initiation factor IF-2 n=1 Tax=Atta colombica TaxID=520822 RepID=A0A195BBL5_9HYME|nr:hypothetical protein ALC53_07976 [Atta colombica]